MTQPRPTYRFGFDAGEIILLAVVLALVYNGFSPHSLPIIAVEPRKLAVPDSVLFPLQQTGSQQEQHAYRIITLRQFERLRAAHRTIVFDARPAEDFRKARIAGAKNIPGQEAENHFDDVAELPRDTMIVVYCNNPDCHLGRILATFLAALDFKNVLLYDDGWDGWVKANEPVDSSRVLN